MQMSNICTSPIQGISCWQQSHKNNGCNALWRRRRTFALLVDRTLLSHTANCQTALGTAHPVQYAAQSKTAERRWRRVTGLQRSDRQASRAASEVVPSGTPSWRPSYWLPSRRSPHDVHLQARSPPCHPASAPATLRHGPRSWRSSWPVPPALPPASIQAREREDAPLVVNPRSLVLESNQVSVFKAYASGVPGDSLVTSIEWTATGGSIGLDGTYSSPSTGDYKVVGKRHGPSGPRSDSAIVDVVPPATHAYGRRHRPGVRRRWPPASSRPSTRSAGYPTATSVAIGVTWTATGGYIDAGGVFTAGSSPGTLPGHREGGVGRCCGHRTGRHHARSGCSAATAARPRRQPAGCRQLPQSSFGVQRAGRVCRRLQLVVRHRGDLHPDVLDRDQKRVDLQSARRGRPAEPSLESERHR